ncbi:FadR/GntR family transcriptional regulator [Rhizorhabdus dicambivorans]|uniref:FadR family transcriptional regulator n=1 Tax=Rhizorhabdus dicambivorans TaxID=1850238 RepID=A0A2A4FU11_9SPHN|nr:FadR/GntR family transcriptional regulator [Rhizorhabdus dicambivorans]ATE64535.1 FadR family transcriptional regulator [Rhizorhabdus dicambivorans]PCE41629.1 FadR family transcriptional regulator [Rhizorhabdus dicambivorans]
MSSHPPGAYGPGEGLSLVQQAMQAVRDHIRDNDLKVGDTLPGEGHFASQLGVSRAVMREAFGALAALRHIDVANGRRARVAGIDGSVMAASLDHAVATSQVSISEIWDVRRTLEVRTAELAAEKRSDEEAARIVAFAEAMAEAGDDMEQVTAADVALHQAIAEASRNPFFLNIIRSFGTLMKMAVPAAWQTRTTDGQRSDVIARHRALARAIADRDPAAARRLMSDHFDRSIDDMLRSAQLER